MCIGADAAALSAAADDFGAESALQAILNATDVAATYCAP